MSLSQVSALHEAVVFFADGRIGKEMLYTEFEALLDCVVPMREFAGHEMRAIYATVDGSLAVRAAVLFLVRFDDDGFPDQRWNVPLRQLAETGVRGPDLGAGPVRLASRSQCPDPPQRQNLWDIESGSGGGNTLELLQERLRMNRLGLDAVAPGAQMPLMANASMSGLGSPGTGAPPPPPAAPSGGVGEEAMLALMRQSQQQLAMLKEQQQRELASVEERVSALQQSLHAVSADRARLERHLEEQMRAREEEQQRGEQRVQSVLEKARTQTAALRRQLEEEHESVLAARDRQMQEELARLQRERQLQDEQLHSLRSELTELRRDKLRLMGGGADKFFDALKAKGVKFVAFQPGAGHLTIPMEDLSSYLEDTEAFVAEKCQVSVEQYRRWLAHYNSPVCQGSAGHGGPCAKPLTRMLKPVDFVAGMHDRCEIHKQVPRSQPLRDASA